MRISPLIIFILVSFCSLAFSWTSSEIKVESLTGSVTAKSQSPAKNNRWKVVKIGQILKAPFVLQTADQSQIQFKTSNGSLLTIGEKSILNFSESSFDSLKGSRDKMHLNQGSLLFKIQKLSSDSAFFEMSTSKVTAAVRGTEGGIEVGEDGSQLYLKEGKLELSDLDQNGRKDELNALEVLMIRDSWSKSKFENSEKLLEGVSANHKLLDQGLMKESLRKSLKKLSPQIKEILKKKAADRTISEQKLLEMEKNKLRTERQILKQKLNLGE